MTTQFELDCGVEDPDQRENLIESIRLQARQQGMKAHVQATTQGSVMIIRVTGPDEGKVLAFEAAIKSWANRRKNG